MARQFKFRVFVGKANVDEQAQRARDAGLEVVGEGLEHISLLVPDAGDGWGAISAQDRILQALQLSSSGYPLRNPVQFLNMVEIEPPQESSWGAERADDRARESKS